MHSRAEHSVARNPSPSQTRSKAKGKTKSNSSTHSDQEVRIELPHQTRDNCSFLPGTSHLPDKLFRHLESYITPWHSKNPPGPTPTPTKQRRTPKAHATATLRNSNMDIGSDLYTQAEQDQYDPQRESSSAAASRVQLSSNTSIAKLASSDDQSSPAIEIDVHEDAFDPVYKSSASTALCRMHELTYSSQWTRPATELLKEILEVRYPPHESEEDDEEETPLLRERQGRWWQRMFAK